MLRCVPEGADPAGAVAKPGHASREPDEKWPNYGQDEIEAVESVLRSGRVNQWTGDRVRSFQHRYSDLLGGRPTVAVANGSLALELALRALGIGPGDDVIVSPRSFAASVFCVSMVGANPVFADVDRDSGNLTAETVSAALTDRVRAVIPVHLAGWPADIPAILDVTRDRGSAVIEDCAQAHGARLGGTPVGAMGHAAAFSFCQDKIISTGGEGGLAAFEDAAAAEWAWSFKDHGKNPAVLDCPQPATGFRWIHDMVGTNWRMTEISAAIGLLQLQKLPAWQALRTRNAGIWAGALQQSPAIRVPAPPPQATHAYYKFYAYVDAGEESAALRDRILGEAAACGIRCFAGSCPEVYRENALSGAVQERLPVARELGETSLMMEVHPTLDEARLGERADALAAIVDRVLRHG